MFKKIIFLLLGSILIGDITVSAAQTIEIDIENGQTFIQKEETIDYEKEYAYKGEDYIYAKVSYLEKEYAIPRSQYWKILRMEDLYCITEENYASFVKADVKSVESGQKIKVSEKKEILPPVKDTRTPWNEWSDEMWDSYTAFAQAFDPDEWQRALLDYYSLTEIYAYYMGGYTIDEGAYKAYLDAQKDDSTDETNRENVTEENMGDTEQVFQYGTICVTPNLFSIYDRKRTYYVDVHNGNKIKELLSEFEYYSEDTVNIKNPNAFVEEKYYFEIGTTDEYITEYVGINKADAQNAIQFVVKNKIGDSDQLSKKEWSSICKVRICTLKKSGAEYDKTFELKYDDVMALISTYLKSNTKIKESELVQVNDPVCNG